MCTAVIGGGENRTVDKGLRGGRRKLRKEEFDDLCVGKNDEVVEVEMDGSVTYMGVQRN